MANEINQIKVGSTTYTLQDSRVDSLVTGVSSVNSQTGDVTINIPTVNNATLTIQKNGTNVATFTANASSNATANITVPTTASDVGAAPKKAGVYLVKGNTTGTAGTWTGTSSDFTDYYDGLVVAYDIGIAGADTTTLNINGKGAKTVYLRGTTKLTTHYAVGTIILLVYSADAGCWYKADYDANTNTYQRLYPTTTNAEYPITARYNTTTGSEYYAEFGRYSTGVTLNPSTKTITATTFKGALDGNAKTATTATTASNATKLGGQDPSYYALASSIPTKTSQLTNDSGFKTTDNNTTYSLSKSGSTITLTGSDGSTTSVTDANSTYSVPVNATTSAVAPSACTSNGFYYVSSSTNSLTDKDGNPFLQYHTSNNDFRILATAYSASWIQQIATDFRSEHVYIRRCENGTWKPWTKIALSSNATTSADGLMSAADKEIVNRFEYDSSGPQLFIDGGASSIDMNDDAVYITANGGLYHDGNEVAVKSDIPTTVDEVYVINGALQSAYNDEYQVLASAMPDITNGSHATDTAVSSSNVRMNPYNGTLTASILNMLSSIQYNGTTVYPPRVIGSSGTSTSSKGYMSLSSSLSTSTNKLKVQWGWISVNADSTGTITFSSAFSGATSYAVILTQGPGTSSSSTTTAQTDSYINGVYVTAKTASNFTYKTMTLKNWLQWIAIGV